MVSVNSTLTWEVTIPDYAVSHSRIQYSTRIKPAGKSDSRDHHRICLEPAEIFKYVCNCDSRLRYSKVRSSQSKSIPAISLNSFSSLEPSPCQQDSDNRYHDLWLGAKGATEFSLTEPLPYKYIIGREGLPEYINTDQFC